MTQPGDTPKGGVRGVLRAFAWFAREIDVTKCERRPFLIFLIHLIFILTIGTVLLWWDPLDLLSGVSDKLDASYILPRVFKYILIAALAVAIIHQCRLLSLRWEIRRNRESVETYDLTEHDWRALEGFRIRAFQLRLWSAIALILGLLIALWGMYLFWEVSLTSKIDTTISRFISEGAILRVATITVAFFMARNLIQFSQYNIRLASFWDARGDALLLKEGLKADDIGKFDTLVNVLSPDIYDFKPTARSTYDKARRKAQKHVSGEGTEGSY